MTSLDLAGVGREMRRNERGEMPKETINQTFVDNGADGSHVNSLSVLWAPKGGAPDAPNGWVNAGYVQVQIVQDDGKTVIQNDRYVHLNEAEIDHLIRKLKRIRNKVWPD